MRKNSKAMSAGRQGFAPIIIIVIVLFLIGAVVLYFYLQRNKSSQLPSSTPTPSAHLQSPIPSPIPTADFTVDWSTYSNTIFGISLKYPTNWTPVLLEGYGGAQPSLTVSYGDYKIVTLLGPSKEAPEECKFGIPDEYIDIIGQNIIARRTVKFFINTVVDNEWLICKKDGAGKYSDQPRITYSTPLLYDQDTLKLMDQIMSTYKFTN